MGEERLEILKMLREGRITVEEAERLLSALDEGERRQAAGPARSAWRDWWRKIEWHGVDEDLKDLAELVRREVEQAVGGPFGERGAARGADVLVREGRFAVPEGDALIVWLPQQEAELVPVEGDTCVIDGEVARVQRAEGRTWVELARAQPRRVRVQVPATVTELRAASSSGSLRAEGLPCEVKLKSMGGSVELLGARARFTVRCLGGEVRVDIASAVDGPCRADAVGGNVEVAIPAGVGGEVQAKSVGGTVQVDPALGEAAATDTASSQRAALTLEGEGHLDLSIHSVGGAVRLRRKSA